MGDSRFGERLDELKQKLPQAEQRVYQAEQKVRGGIDEEVMIGNLSICDGERRFIYTVLCGDKPNHELNRQAAINYVASM